MPLGARARVSHGFGVVIRGNHLNETAPSGYVARLVRILVCRVRLNHGAGHDCIGCHGLLQVSSASGSHLVIALDQAEKTDVGSSSGSVSEIFRLKLLRV